MARARLAAVESGAGWREAWWQYRWGAMVLAGHVVGFKYSVKADKCWEILAGLSKTGRALLKDRTTGVKTWACKKTGKKTEQRQLTFALYLHDCALSAHSC
eukprot:scaffold308533_cov60-Attheya_sp.AAC.2